MTEPRAAQAIRTGFVGLGDMGGPIAHHLVANFPTTLWARRPASLEPYAGTGFRAAADLVDLGRTCDVVGICVFSDADVRAVVLGGRGLLAGLAPGAVLVIHSTISAETAMEIEAVAREGGVGVLDAPVSGSRIRSRAGTLTIMVGGARETYQRALPVLETYGEIIRHMGPIGSGQKMKVLNNVLGFCNMRMAHLAIETAERLGLDRQAAMDVLRTSSGGSSFLNTLIDRVLPDAGDAARTLRAVEKDTGIFQQTRTEAGIERLLLDELAEGAVEVLRALSRRDGAAE